MLVVSRAIREAMEPQIQVQVRLAEIEADSSRDQVAKETALIATEQEHRHSRFKHWFWGILVGAAAFFGLAVALFFTGREQAGALVLSHFFATALGAFGGRSFAKNKATESADD